MKAIYYNIFGLGHINPTLPLVKALNEKGVEIIYHSSPERRELIEAAGAKFINYGYDEYKAGDFNPGKNFVLQTIPATVGLLPFLTEEFERVRPDFIIYDSMAIWGYVIGLIYNIPSFCTVTTFALSEESKQQTFKRHGVTLDDVNVQSLKYLKEKYQIDLSLGHTLGAYGKHNIVFTSSEFNPPIKEETLDFFYSGAMIENNRLDINFPMPAIIEIRKNKKIITMAFGSILTVQDPEIIFLYKKLIEAFFEDENHHLILAVGSEENLKKLGDLPSHIMAFPRIPQTEVLKHTDCFINHAGMNSVNEALHLGVPLLVIPHSHDQFGNAKRVGELKLGFELNQKEVTKEILREKVQCLLTDQRIADNVKAMSASFLSCKGLDGILNYIKLALH